MMGGGLRGASIAGARERESQSRHHYSFAAIRADHQLPPDDADGGS